MFAFAILIGVYSYVIFTLGVLGYLYKIPVIISTFIFIVISIVFFKRNKKGLPKFLFRNKKLKPFLFLFGILAVINLVGALGPEISFDALWYHLTVPKIFIQEHKIFYIEGGLFYYSLMPKLSEMLFIPGLMLDSEIIPKLIHWAFGISSSIAIYKISRKLFDKKISIISSLIFYSNLVVSWQSSVAYVDLTRTFFEIMALWGFLEFYKSKNKKWLIESALMMGLAISTKLVALGTLLIFAALIVYVSTSGGRNIKQFITNIQVYMYISILVALPWFAFSFINAGNPIYPVFSNLYPVEFEWSLLNPINILKDLFILFFKSNDPISPIYIVFFPLIFIYFKKLNKEIKIIFIYSVLALLIWYITPRTGGGRFIMPYLPAFSIMAAWIIANTKTVWLRKYLIGFVVVVCLITITYRGVANFRYVPVILGNETKQEFLTKNLNFDFGDFYDTDGFFKKTIKPNDLVLLFGFHNLYYANFPFIHESYIKKGDKFNYIATQDAILPERFSYWSLVYQNEVTHVKVYSLGGKSWNY